MIQLNGNLILNKIAKLGCGITLVLLYVYLTKCSFWLDLKFFNHLECKNHLHYWSIFTKDYIIGDVAPTGADVAPTEADEDTAGTDGDDESEEETSPQEVTQFHLMWPLWSMLANTKKIFILARVVSREWW